MLKRQKLRTKIKVARKIQILESLRPPEANNKKRITFNAKAQSIEKTLN